MSNPYEKDRGVNISDIVCCTSKLHTVYDRVYHTPGDNILGFGISSPGVVYRGGMVYTVPPVIKWAVVWDFRLFTPGGIP